MTTLASASARALHPSDGIAVIVLLENEHAAADFAHLLDDVQRQRGVVADTHIPPVRGEGFFDHPDMDAWWGEHVRGDALPLWVVQHTAELPGWIDSVDGLFVVVGEQAEMYGAHPRVSHVPALETLDILSAVMHELNGRGGADPTPMVGLRQRASRGRFRRAELRPAEEALPGETSTLRGSAQFFQPTRWR